MFPFNFPSEYILQHNSSERYSNNSTPKHKQRGLCIFINILKERPHSDKDVKRVEETFSRLGYKVELYEDVTRMQLNEILRGVRMRLNKNEIRCESLVVFVGAHGDSQGMQLWDGERVRPEDIVASFLPCVCPELEGKAKLFFFETCRQVSESGICREGEVLYDRDVMTSFSSAFGGISYRSSDGSFYIKTLCDLLECPVWSRCPLISILSQLTKCVRKQSLSRCESEQNPVLWSGLSNEFYFHRPYSYCSSMLSSYSSFFSTTLCRGSHAYNLPCYPTTTTTFPFSSPAILNCY